MKYGNRGQCSCIFKSSRGQKDIKMQKITHKFKVLRKQHSESVSGGFPSYFSIILVNPMEIENNLFADIENWLL